MNSEYKDKLQKFYKYQVRYFRICGLYRLPMETSKPKKLAYKFHFAIIFCWLIIYNFGTLIAFFIQPTILDMISKVFFVLAALIASMSKMCYLKKNCSSYQELVALLYKDTFVPMDPFEYAVFQRNFNLCKHVRNYYSGVSILTMIYMFLLQQMTNRHELPIPVYIPFEIKTDLVFKLVEVYAYLSIAIMCFMNIAYDSWCASLLMFAKTQLEMLQYRFETVGKDTVSDLAINRELKKCIYHHEEVFKFMKFMETAISVPVSIQIFCSISVLCCNFYAMSFVSVEDDFLNFGKFFIYQVTMLAQIFLICHFSNEVTLASIKLSHALYSSNWTTWSRTNRKLILYTMQRLQSPIVLRAINRCYSFDLTAFASIVNTSYTYFALLKQMNNN